MAINREKTFFVIFLVLMAAHVALIAAIDIYPFHDLPFALAAATIHRFYDDPSTIFDQYYARDLSLQPNTFHFHFCSLGVFPSVEFANKVFYVLYVLLLPVSVLLAIRKLGGNVWFSLLSFLVLYNVSVSRGFVGFTIAIPVVVLIFYLLLRLLDGGGRWNRVAMAALFVVLFFMHALATVFALAVFFVSLFYCYRKAPAKIPLAAVSTAPAVAMLIWWGVGGLGVGASMATYLLDYYGHRYVQTLASRINLFYVDGSHLLSGAQGIAIGLVFSLFITAWLLLGLAKRRGASGAALVGVKCSPALIFLLASLFFCLAVPKAYPPRDVWQVSVRFSVFFLISAIIVGSTRCPDRLRRLRTVGTLVLVILHLTLWAAYFADFDSENRAVKRSAFPRGGKDRSLAGLIYDTGFRGKPMYKHFSNYHIVWNRGIAVTRLVDFDIGPIKRKVDKRLLPEQFGGWGERRSYAGQYGGMDYILVRGNVPHADSVYLDVFRLCKQQGPWSLYEHRGDTSQ